MTLIETRLIHTILDRAMTALAEAWKSIRSINFTLGEMESNPQIMQIVPPNEVVVVIGFEIKMTNRAGTMSLCIPFNALEPVVEDLSAQSWFLAGRLGEGDQWASRVATRLADARLSLSGILADTTMTLSELQGLEVGDLITTAKPAAAPVLLAAEGVPKFLAHIGQHKGHRALKIVRPIEAEDRLSGL